MDTHHYQKSGNDFDSLSFRDLLEARDAYHVHLLNYPHVVATAVGRYRIRIEDSWPDADGTIKPIKLTNQGVGALRKASVRRPNLALAGTATASSVRPNFKVRMTPPTPERTETFEPDLATDDSNGSRWMAAGGDASPWWQIDLGEPRDIVGTEAYFVKPAAGHAYKLESSLDGKTWSPYGGHDDVVLRSPHVDKKAARVRYLRLTILKGEPGLWEFRVY